MVVFTMELTATRWNSQKQLIDAIADDLRTYMVEVYVTNPSDVADTVAMTLSKPYGLAVLMEPGTASDLTSTGYDRYRFIVPAGSQGPGSGQPALTLLCEDPSDQLRFYTLSVTIS